MSYSVKGIIIASISTQGTEEQGLLNPPILGELTLRYKGYKMLGFTRGGGHYGPPPWKQAKMKLQRHVRGQTRSSWVCPVHLDYFQAANMCISHVFTWF